MAEWIESAPPAELTLPSETAMRLCEVDAHSEPDVGRISACRWDPHARDMLAVARGEGGLQLWNYDSDSRHCFALFTSVQPLPVSRADGSSEPYVPVTSPRLVRARITDFHFITGRPGELVFSLWQSNKVFHTRFPPAQAQSGESAEHTNAEPSALHWYFRGSRVVELGSGGGSDAGEVQALALCPHGNYVASGTGSGDLRLWEFGGDGAEPEGLERDVVRRAHAVSRGGGVTALCFARQGAVLVSAGGDRSIFVWGIREPYAPTGSDSNLISLVGVLRTDSVPISALLCVAVADLGGGGALSGEALFSGTACGTLRVWDLNVLLDAVLSREDNTGTSVEGAENAGIVTAQNALVAVCDHTYSPIRCLAAVPELRMKGPDTECTVFSPLIIAGTDDGSLLLYAPAPMAVVTDEIHCDQPSLSPWTLVGRESCGSPVVSVDMTVRRLAALEEYNELNSIVCGTGSVAVVVACEGGLIRMGNDDGGLMALPLFALKEEDVTPVHTVDREKTMHVSDCGLGQSEDDEEPRKAVPMPSPLVTKEVKSKGVAGVVDNEGDDEVNHRRTLPVPEPQVLSDGREGLHHELEEEDNDIRPRRVVPTPSPHKATDVSSAVFLPDGSPLPPKRNEDNDSIEGHEPCVGTTLTGVTSASKYKEKCRKLEDNHVPLASPRKHRLPPRTAADGGNAHLRPSHNFASRENVWRPSAPRRGRDGWPDVTGSTGGKRDEGAENVFPNSTCFDGWRNDDLPPLPLSLLQEPALNSTAALQTALQRLRGERFNRACHKVALRSSGFGVAQASKALNFNSSNCDRYVSLVSVDVDQSEPNASQPTAPAHLSRKAPPAVRPGWVHTPMAVREREKLRKKQMEAAEEWRIRLRAKRMEREGLSEAEMCAIEEREMNDCIEARFHRHYSSDVTPTDAVAQVVAPGADSDESNDYQEEEHSYERQPDDDDGEENEMNDHDVCEKEANANAVTEDKLDKDTKDDAQSIANVLPPRPWYTRIDQGDGRGYSRPGWTSSEFYLAVAPSHAQREVSSGSVQSNGVSNEAFSFNVKRSATQVRFHNFHSLRGLSVTKDKAINKETVPQQIYKQDSRDSTVERSILYRRAATAAAW